MNLERLLVPSCGFAAKLKVQAKGMSEEWRNFGNLEFNKSSKSIDKCFSWYQTFLDSESEASLSELSLKKRSFSEEERKAVEMTISEHFYRCNSEIGDIFTMEANLEIGSHLKIIFTKLSSILYELKHEHSLFSALKWIESVKEESNGFYLLSLEFSLIKMQFTSYLYNQEKRKAVEYARGNFSKFIALPNALNEIQSLMGLLLCTDRESLELTQTQWDKVTDSFSFAYCHFHKIPSKCSFDLCVDVGTLALSQIVKINSFLPPSTTAGTATAAASNNITKTVLTSWSSAEELPINIKLPEANSFHSVFVCPVLKSATSVVDPKVLSPKDPMMLPCGHVICREALGRLSSARNGNAKFKCPYCPLESSASQALAVIF